MQLAHELKQPLQVVQVCTTATEFFDWLVFLEELETSTTKADFYAAQIALEVRRVLMQHPNRVNLKDFLIDFTQRSKPVQQAPEVEDDWLEDWLDDNAPALPPPPLTPAAAEHQKNRLALSKGRWAAFLGVGPSSSEG